MVTACWKAFLLQHPLLSMRRGFCFPLGSPFCLGPHMRGRYKRNIKVSLNRNEKISTLLILTYETQRENMWEFKKISYLFFLFLLFPSSASPFLPSLTSFHPFFLFTSHVVFKLFLVQIWKNESKFSEYIKEVQKSSE